MYQTILAAVDASPIAPRVVTTALELAERFDGHVYLFRAVLLPQEFPAASRQPPDDLPAFLEREARAGLAALAAGRPRVQALPPEVGFSQPWRAILATAERLAVDLLVIGSHSYSHWDRIVGTTAARVSSHASCSVMIVHTRNAKVTESRSS